jgi:hypothetical protein
MVDEFTLPVASLPEFLRGGVAELVVVAGGAPSLSST